jgi:hypothetical protein
MENNRALKRAQENRAEQSEPFLQTFDNVNGFSDCCTRSKTRTMSALSILKVSFSLALLLPMMALGAETNNPARIERGETWFSKSRLQRIAMSYAKQKKIDFAFDGTHQSVSYEKRGTNFVATTYFTSGMFKPMLAVEIAPSGEVLTNRRGLMTCAVGSQSLQTNLTNSAARLR